MNKIWFNTGSVLLDEVIGGGLGKGIPAGKIINIVGDKSTGKTFFACEIIANAFYSINKKFKWVYDDAESGLTHNTNEIYGFNIIPEKEKDRVKSRTVEDWYCNYREFLDSLKKDECGIYVLDSLDGVDSEENKKRGNKRLNAFKKGKEFKEGSYQMGKAKFLSQEFFRGLAAESEEKNCSLIIISQTRDKIDSLFREQTRSGGKSLDFYAFCCLWLANVSKIIKRERAIGVIIKALAKKSKTPRPYRSCILPVYFDYGIDDIGANLDFLFDLRGKDYLLRKNKDSIQWEKNDSAIRYGLTDLKNFLKENNIYNCYIESIEGKEFEGRQEKINNILLYIDDLEGEIKEKFNKKFGVGISKLWKRGELIKHIEENDLQDKLAGKVLEKWENIESEIRIDRKKKYG